jgi:hypothetical protein
MATPEVLRALVKNALDRNNELLRETRDQAMKTLLTISSVESNLKQMATHEGLVRAFVQYAATSPETAESKKEVKKVIMALVPLL